MDNDARSVEGGRLALESVSPQTGPVAGGTAVVVAWSTPGSAVALSDVRCVFGVVGSPSLRCRVKWTKLTQKTRA